MMFTKKHANENKAIKARAREVLIEIGHTKEREAASKRDFLGGLPYIEKVGRKVEKRLQDEFPDVLAKRLRSHVYHTMTEIRSEHFCRNCGQRIYQVVFKRNSGLCNKCTISKK
jgi:hypothetical protein